MNPFVILLIEVAAGLVAICLAKRVIRHIGSPRVQCAWCRTERNGWPFKRGTVSHGLCEDCFDEMHAEIAREAR